MEGSYKKSFEVTLDKCDSSAKLSFLSVFNIFQELAIEHAERIGIGFSNMYKNNEFWLISHSRIDFCKKASLFKKIDAITWPEPGDENSFKVYRDYKLECEGEVLALGKTEWAVLNEKQRPKKFKDSCFPKDLDYVKEKSIEDEPKRMTYTFEDEDLFKEYVVQSTDIDIYKHMNNVAYIRLLLSCFKSEVIASDEIKTIEIHYGRPCFEDEKLSIFRKQEGNEIQFGIKKEDGKTAALAVFILS